MALGRIYFLKVLLDLILLFKNERKRNGGMMGAHLIKSHTVLNEQTDTGV